jgi:replication factor C subunit 2/4
MEQYSRITRFCLVCNYVTRIIEPLASRCSKFRFKALDGVAAGDRLEEIAKAENLTLENGTVETLIRCSEGDLRRAITYMQSAARLVGQKQHEQQPRGGDEDVELSDADSSSEITIRTVEEIAGVVPESVLDRLTQAMQPKKLGSAYEAVAAVVSDIVADGWSATQILSQVCESDISRSFCWTFSDRYAKLYHRVVFNDAIPDIQKNRIVIVFSEMDKRLVDGSDEHLSILDMVMRISGILGS